MVSAGGGQEGVFEDKIGHCSAYICSSACSHHFLDSWMWGRKKAKESVMEGDYRDSHPVVLVPRADGTQVFEGTASLIDASHLEDGYVMVKYTGDGRIKMQLTHDDEEPYTYDLPTSGEFQTFPLTSGDGHYTLNIYRNISGDQYAFVDGASFDVRLKNEFTPFCIPVNTLTIRKKPRRWRIVKSWHRVHRMIWTWSSEFMTM